ncbi:MAG: hypothetical protein QXU75_07230 [Candidatus Methanomethylicaceae archaeon]
MGRFDVWIGTRDFIGMIALGDIEIIPERYRVSVIGGCAEAELSVRGNKQSLFDLFNILRCPIEIFYDGIICWWGYIEKVEVCFGTYTIGVSLENMANRVAITYSVITVNENGETELGQRATTSWAEDTISIATYGVRELIVSAGGMNDSQADNARNIILNSFSKPVSYVEMNTGMKANTGRIFAKGWWNTLDWKYYQQTQTTSADLAIVLSEIVSTGQFITGVTRKVTSGISGGRYRDGTLTIRDEAERLMRMGTSNGKRMLATVTRERNIVIYEEKSLNVFRENYHDFTISADGNVRDQYGSELAVYKCPVGVCVLSDSYVMQIDTARMSDPRVIFVEEAEYSREMGYLPVARGQIGPWDIIQRITG